MDKNPRYGLVASDEPRPMAETLMDYARPLISQLPRDHTDEELKATVGFAAIVWNVGGFSEVRDAVRYLSRQVPARMRVDPARALAIIRRMLTWKDRCFAGDDRCALAVDVERNGPVLRVRAIGVVRTNSVWDKRSRLQ
jgi:hypothetical protein